MVHSLDNPFKVLPLNAYTSFTKLDDRHMLLGTEEGLVMYDIFENKIVPDDLPSEVKNIFSDWIRVSANGDLFYRGLCQRKNVWL